MNRGAAHTGIALAAALAMIAWGNFNRDVASRVAEELEVVPPVVVQLGASLGDRFLAANVNAWRAIMVGTAKLSPATLDGLATLQEEASWFNPAHEDNYYVATAILPWEGKIAPTQTILSRAIDGRPDDLWPPFYWGFNQIHFLGDGAGAAKGALIAAERAEDDQSKDALRGIAARWSEKGEDPHLSLRLLRSMADATRDKSFKLQLEKRMQRIEGLVELQEANRRFVERHGRHAAGFEELIQEKYIGAMPVDPIGHGYEFGKDGPTLRP